MYPAFFVDGHSHMYPAKLRWRPQPHVPGKLRWRPKTPRQILLWWPQTPSVGR